MVKTIHEIRDPVHNFIRLSSDERKILDSRHFQRLRYINQLATTYLVYPGATHKRFEHSLGVMELATKVFDVVTNEDNIYNESIRNLIKTEKDRLQYWKRVIRMAALCHDIGHFPFSHAAEILLPKGKTHESLTLSIIMNGEISDILNSLKIYPSDVAKLALSPKDYKKEDKKVEYSSFEGILSEIITGDAFGVDRMDYLLRDSHHAGVAYGKFDHYRLIDTIRILPKTNDDSCEPALGIEEGGIHSAESFSLARYYMFSQLYLHPVRRAYDIHLADFLKEYLPKIEEDDEYGKFPIDIESHLNMTDNEVLSGMLEASRNPETKGHESATRIMERKHFKRAYTLKKDDLEKNIDALRVLYDASCEKFGQDMIRIDEYKKPSRELNFPVLVDDNKVVSSSKLSSVFKEPEDGSIGLTGLSVGYIFAEPEIRDEVKKYINNDRDMILASNKISESTEDKE